ncbi:hypothetical protein [Pragia fontium]|uniref:hypothetical protein n=1 Tax=Pragia fontium TaxID=82985 RepID=UPI00064B802F|nr:hypothetical protein [Pragia fontium]AKJ41782.1 hypothetical protein QQ39_06545 [Pragia fontium]
MDDFCLHKDTFQQLGVTLQTLISTGKRYRVRVCEWKEKRSLGQNDLSHVWYDALSKYLISKGRTECSPKWVKRAMKHTYLGYEDIEMVDVVTGERTTRQELRHTADLDTGAMHFYLTQVEGWALNVGCMLAVPAGCEYQQLQQKQVA